MKAKRRRELLIPNSDDSHVFNNDRSISSEIHRGIAPFDPKNSIPQLSSLATGRDFSSTGKATKKKKPRQQLK